MKKFKKSAKSLLSLTLVLVMMVSVLQLPALAADLDYKTPANGYRVEYASSMMQLYNNVFKDDTFRATWDSILKNLYNYHITAQDLPAIDQYADTNGKNLDFLPYINGGQPIIRHSSGMEAAVGDALKSADSSSATRDYAGAWPIDLEKYDGDVFWRAHHDWDNVNGLGDREVSSYIVLFYDFKVKMDGIYMDFSSDDLSVSNPDSSSESYLDNETSMPAQLSVGFTRTESGTVTNSTSNSYSKTVGGSTTVSVSFPIKAVTVGVKQQVNYSWTNTSSWTNATSNMEGTTTTTDMSITLPPYSKLAISQMSEQVKSPVNYKGSGRIDFKVAVVYTNEDDEDNKRYLYLADVLDTEKIGSNAFPYNDSTLQTLFDSRQPYAPLDGTLTMDMTRTIFTPSAILPLYNLDNVKIQPKSVTVPLGESLDLRDVQYEGLNKFNARYHDYEALPAQWELISGDARIAGDALVSNEVGSSVVRLKLTAPNIETEADDDYFDVYSEDLNVTFKSPSMADSTLALRGEIGTLELLGTPPAQSFDLNNLEVYAIDGGGNEYPAPSYTWHYDGEEDESPRTITFIDTDDDGKDDTMNVTEPGNYYLYAKANTGHETTRLGFRVIETRRLDKIGISGVASMYIGDTCDLYEVLSYYDQYGDVFPKPDALTFNLGSAQNGPADALSIVEEPILSALLAGSESLSVSCDDIVSNTVFFDILEKPYLVSMETGQKLPVLLIKEDGSLTSETLSDDALTGKDQYGQPFDLSSNEFEWEFVSGEDYADIDNDLISITAKAAGHGEIRAVSGNILGQPVYSNAMPFRVVEGDTYNPAKIVVTPETEIKINTASSNSTFRISSTPPTQLGLKVTVYDQLGLEYIGDISELKWSSTNDTCSVTKTAGEWFFNMRGQDSTELYAELGELSSNHVKISLYTPTPPPPKPGPGPNPPADIVDDPTPLNPFPNTLLSEKTDKLPYYFDSESGEKIYVVFSWYDDTDATMHYLAYDGVKYFFDENPKLFSDIKGHWAEDNINFTAEREVFEGTAPNVFSPNMTLSRAMMVTIMARIAGVSDETLAKYTTSRFDDIADGAWYLPYAEWAADNGLLTGTQSKVAEPERNVTRAEMAVFMDRLITYLKLELAKIEAPVFTDIQGHWARESIERLSSYSLLSGKAKGQFDPNGNSTRAEAATVVERLVEYVVRERIALSQKAVG